MGDSVIFEVHPSPKNLILDYLINFREQDKSNLSEIIDLIIYYEDIEISKLIIRKILRKETEQHAIGF